MLAPMVDCRSQGAGSSGEPARASRVEKPDRWCLRPHAMRREAKQSNPRPCLVFIVWPIVHQPGRADAAIREFDPNTDLDWAAGLFQGGRHLVPFAMNGGHSIPEFDLAAIVVFNQLELALELAADRFVHRVGKELELA